MSHSENTCCWRLLLACRALLGLGLLLSFAALHCAGMRVRLFVVVAARAAEEEQNLLGVLGHDYDAYKVRQDLVPTSMSSLLLGLGSICCVVNSAEMPSSFSEETSRRAASNTFASDWESATTSTPTTPPISIVPLAGGVYFHPAPTKAVSIRLHKSSDSLLVQYGVMLNSWPGNTFSCRITTPIWASVSVRDVVNLAMRASEIVWRCLDKTNSPNVPIISPAAPTIVSTMSILARPFHFSDLAFTSTIHAIKKIVPKRNVIPTEISDRVSVADCDNDGAPIDPYALAFAIFWVVEILIVAVVLVCRVLKNGDGHNSN